jgi:acetyl-CoA carboxylase biotin carboxyl carrier protein
VRAALIDGMSLLSPSVGTWRPAVGLGAPVVAGDLLGVLERAGERLEVVVPVGVAGAVIPEAAPGAWVQATTPLVRLGEGVGVAATRPAAAVSGGPEGAVAVRAETDGTVYLRPGPGKPAFAPEGAEVAAATTVALVEVMKTFTPARAGVAGRVVRVDVADGASVSAGAALLWVVPGV